MGLSCNCYFDVSTADYDWIWYMPNDFLPWPQKRGKKCASCGKMVKPGDDCAIITRWRAPKNDVEYKIHGEEDIEIAPYVWCEECAGLAFSLNDLGYCFYIEDNMRELAKEHAAERKE